MHSSGLLMMMGQFVGIPLIFIIDFMIKKSGDQKVGATITDAITPIAVFLVSVMLFCCICIGMYRGELKRLAEEQRESFLESDEQVTSAEVLGANSLHDELTSQSPDRAGEDWEDSPSS